MNSFSIIFVLKIMYLSQLTLSGIKKLVLIFIELLLQQQFSHHSELVTWLFLHGSHLE